MSVLTADYRESLYKNFFYEDIFKFVWWRGMEQYFDNRDQCTTPTLRSDMDPNVPERLLRP
jgi:hypothetical protein